MNLTYQDQKQLYQNLITNLLPVIITHYDEFIHKKARVSNNGNLQDIAAAITLDYADAMLKTINQRENQK